MKSLPTQLCYHRGLGHRPGTEGSVAINFFFTGWSLCFSKYCYRHLEHVFILILMSLLDISPNSLTDKPFYKSFFSSAEKTLCDLLQSLWYGELNNKATEYICTSLKNVFSLYMLSRVCGMLTFFKLTNAWILYSSTNLNNKHFLCHYHCELMNILSISKYQMSSCVFQFSMWKQTCTFNSEFGLNSLYKIKPGNLPQW